LEQLSTYNRERFEDLISASWDLVIIDEAHRMGGSTDQVARYKLGAALSEAAPYLLLLSATPHQGKTDQFHRLMQLLDRDSFPDETSVSSARELMTADLSRVHAMMRGTIADPLTAPEAARMAESIRAVFNVNAKALKLLPTSGRRFSVRDWIEEGANEDEGANAKKSGSMVFISARYVDMSVCAQLLTLWLDTAMNTLMTMPRTKDLKCWFFIDELGALHRLPALEKGLQTARNFGGAIVTGIHAYAKLKEVYGENMAMTLASLARTKLILGTADRETATWCSDFIGHRQVRDMEEGYMLGRLDLAYALNAHMAQGLTSDRGIAVMDSRERNLANQQTFLVTITRLRDGLTLFVDNAGKLEAAVERNPGMKRSALETVNQLRDAAAMGQAKGKASDRSQEPAREPPELDRSITKPFEIGI
jgi:hypothetical protein